MTLYHGSMYKQTELMPGFKRTGILQEWDQTESNEWLYATTNMDEAIRQGLYSLLASQFDVKRFSSAGRRVLIDIYPDQKGEKLAAYNEFKHNARNFFNAFRLYLYCLDQFEADGWLRNINPHNHLRTEWKTQSIVMSAIRHVTEIQPMLWMSRRDMLLEFIEPGKKTFFLSC